MAHKSDLRRYLWEADPKCYWCEIETVYTEMKGGKFKINEATIDHYFSKYHKEDRARWGNPVVLACYKCNHDRGAKETSEQPIEELWRRAGHYDQVVKRRASVQSDHQ